MKMTVKDWPRELNFLINHVAEGYIRINNNIIEQVNDSLLDMLGYQSENDLPKFFPELIFEPSDYITYSNMFIEQQEYSNYDLSLKGGRGEKVIVRCELQSAADNIVYLLVEDITLQHKKLKELMTISTVFEYNPYMVLITNGDGDIENVNQQFRNRTGYTEKDILGKNIFKHKALISPLCGLDKNDTLREILRKPEFVGEFTSVSKDQSVFIEEIHIAPVYSNGVLVNLLFIGNDITDKKQHYARLEDLAYHDQMTGLIRRDVFGDVATNLKENADRNNDKLGMIFLDLDKFKPVNDEHGHYTGDRVLIECAERFKKIFRSSDVICRQGGDEFSVICPQLKDMSDLETIGKKINSEITQKTFDIDGLEINIGISIGGCLYSGKQGNSTSLNKLIEFADCLMYEAKAHPDQGYVLKKFN